MPEATSFCNHSLCLSRACLPSWLSSCLYNHAASCCLPSWLSGCLVGFRPGATPTGQGCGGRQQPLPRTAAAASSWQRAVSPMAPRAPARTSPQPLTFGHPLTASALHCRVPEDCTALCMWARPHFTFCNWGAPGLPRRKAFCIGRAHISHSGAGRAPAARMSQGVLQLGAPIFCIMELGAPQLINIARRFCFGRSRILLSQTGRARAAPYHQSLPAGGWDAQVQVREGARRVEQPQRVVLAVALGHQPAALAQNDRRHAVNEEVGQRARAAVHAGARRGSLAQG